MKKVLANRDLLPPAQSSSDDNNNLITLLEALSQKEEEHVATEPQKQPIVEEQKVEKNIIAE